MSDSLIDRIKRLRDVTNNTEAWVAYDTCMNLLRAHPTPDSSLTVEQAYEKGWRDCDRHHGSHSSEIPSTKGGTMNEPPLINRLKRHKSEWDSAEYCRGIDDAIAVISQYKGYTFAERGHETADSGTQQPISGDTALHS